MSDSLYDRFKGISPSVVDRQYLFDTVCGIKIYYGITSESKYRLSFLSDKPSHVRGETNHIKVVVGPDASSFWTCFDLNDGSFLEPFCVLGDNLITCLQGETDQTIALDKLAKQYSYWLKLLKTSSKSLSKEQIKGLYGELYCLKNIIVPIYGWDKSIRGWSGPDNFSKDFAIDETWFEIKTTNVVSPVVKISSISQLESNKTGHLLVVKLEEMSPQYSATDCSITGLCKSILDEISDTELVNLFISKLENQSFELFGSDNDLRFNVHEINKYKIDEEFPCLKLTSKQAEVISNASYELVLVKLEEYKEE